MPFANPPSAPGDEANAGATGGGHGASAGAGEGAAAGAADEGGWGWEGSVGHVGLVFCFFSILVKMEIRRNKELVLCLVIFWLIS